MVSLWFSAIRWCQEDPCLLVCQASVKPTAKNSKAIPLCSSFQVFNVLRKLPPGGPCSPYIPLLGLYPSRFMELCSRASQHYRSRCLYHGGCWFQGQVVGRFPSSCVECIQCIRKQLVECTLQASSARFLEVSCPSSLYCQSGL